MQHVTGIRINAGLSLQSRTACVAGFLGVVTVFCPVIASNGLDSVQRKLPRQVTVV